MKAHTLAEFKKRAREFSNLYEKLVTLWNGELQHGNNATYPETVLIQVLLHNIAFDATDCQGYNHTRAVEEVEKNIKMLEEIDKYHRGCYMTHYPWNEMHYLWDGMSHSEDYEDFPMEP